MGEFSLTHLLIIAVLFLVFFGPSRIEGLGKSLGKSIRGFKDGLNEIDADSKDVTHQRLDAPPKGTDAARSNVAADAEKKKTEV